VTQNAGAVVVVPQLGETELHSSRAPERSVTLWTHAGEDHLLLLMLPSSHVVVILLRRAADKLFEVFARKERRVGALVHFFFQLGEEKSGDLAQKKNAYYLTLSINV
jgi:hypothetical protein